MSPVKNICCGLICLCYVQFAGAQNKPDHKKVSIRGQIGASSNFYSSNEAVYTRPSFSWNANGNFVARINQVDLPFSFVINQYNNKTV